MDLIAQLPVSTIFLGGLEAMQREYPLCIESQPRGFNCFEGNIYRNTTYLYDESGDDDFYG